MTGKKNIALVLSSGGARGIAHIGVIEELLKRGYRITSIAGSSMGALVGGVYAAGGLEKLTEHILHLDKVDFFKLLDFSFSSSGLVKGDKVMKFIETYVPERNIEDLRISYKALATDIIHKKEVVFDKGDLFQAIRASIAIPTVFTPVPWQDTMLVDGGVLNPVPINFVERNPDDMLVVVNVNAMIPYPRKIREKAQLSRKKALDIKGKKQAFKNKLSLLLKKKNHKEHLGYFNLLTTTIELMLGRLGHLSIEKYPPDVLINISRSSYGTYDFLKAAEIIKMGRSYAVEALDRIDH
ncbi:MAG: patatin-like phospholipase family protein [Bacteroidales bacterium]|nr:patatin-like phospholipase family protein [Bacteroidales bacterium]